MDKPAIKKFAVWARNKLIADTKYRAGLVGVTETAVAEPLPQSNETVQFFDVGLPQPYRIEGDAVSHVGLGTVAVNGHSHHRTCQTGQLHSGVPDCGG
mgnify:CR=1 FL=1